MALKIRSAFIALVLVLGLMHRAINYIYTNEDDHYVYQNKEDLELDKAALSATFVMVVAYARSGSSWLGEILSKAEESFYMFEPMQRPLAQGYHIPGLVCFNNNSYRRPASLLERHDFMITTMHRLFTCQFSKLHVSSQKILVHHQVRMNPGSFSYCINNGSFASYFCINELEQLCLSKTHRIVKTIRISMELVSDMVELWPNLKVIHLVRDPRAITDSRINGKDDWNMVFDTVRHSADLCTRMYEDIKQDWYIQSKYPNRLIIVSYEALAGAPYAATGYMYRFLDMLCREKTWIWVHQSMKNKRKKETYYYSTVRFNSTKVANRWRAHLTYWNAQEVDHSCTDVYKALGYVPIKSEEHLRKEDVPVRKKVDSIVGYL